VTFLSQFDGTNFGVTQIYAKIIVVRLDSGINSFFPTTCIASPRLLPAHGLAVVPLIQ